MPWGGEMRATCKTCYRKREPDEIFSARGKCRACGNGRSTANATQLHLHSGPYFQRWREGMAASVGAQLVDEQPEQS